MTTSAAHSDAAGDALPVHISYPETADEGLIAIFECVTDSDWVVSGDVTRGPFGLVITRLEVRRPGDSTGVTSSLLRKIPVGEILAAVQTEIAAELMRRGGEGEAFSATLTLMNTEPARTSGRAPLSPQLLREVALAYIAENGPGKGPGAMTRLAEKFDKPEETVRRWVKRARSDGWLGPGAKGRAGAEPGPKLIMYGFAEGIDEPEPHDGAPTGGDYFGAKRGFEAQLAEHNKLYREWQSLPDGDPRKAELERELRSSWSTPASDS